MRFQVEQSGICDRYPQLARRKFEDDSLLRFCIAYCAPDSPLKDERDFDMRKEIAFGMIGLDRFDEARIRKMIANYSRLRKILEQLVETNIEVFKRESR